MVAADAPGNASVRVEDNGAGLPYDEWERVFEPYYRFHEAAGQPDSVGIGLAISRRLARLMAGDLSYRRVDDWSVLE